MSGEGDREKDSSKRGGREKGKNPQNLDIIRSLFYSSHPNNQHVIDNEPQTNDIPLSSLEHYPPLGGGNSEIPPSVAAPVASSASSEAGFQQHVTGIEETVIETAQHSSAGVATTGQSSSNSSIQLPEHPWSNIETVVVGSIAWPANPEGPSAVWHHVPPEAVMHPVPPEAVMHPVHPEAVMHPVHPEAVMHPLHPAAVRHPLHPAAVRHPLHPAAVRHPLHPAAVRHHLHPAIHWHHLHPPALWHPLHPAALWHPLHPANHWHPLHPAALWQPLHPAIHWPTGPSIHWPENTFAWPENVTPNVIFTRTWAPSGSYVWHMRP